MSAKAHLVFLAVWIASIFLWLGVRLNAEPRVVYDCPGDIEPYTADGVRHLHCPEELIGGGYRNGKFVYLKDVK